MPILDPETSPVVPVDAARKAIKALIEAALPDAKVWSRWPLRFDTRKSVTYLKDGSGAINAWIITTTKLVPTTTYGVWDAELRLLGFKAFELGTEDGNPQDTQEAEAEAVSAWLRQNAQGLGTDYGCKLRIKEEKFLPVWEFSQEDLAVGTDVLMVEGFLTVEITTR